MPFRHIHFSYPHELDTFAATKLQPQKHVLTRAIKPHICLTQWKVAAWR
nr:MAG TPA: hypothetical protein [Caudoviricetes sp.]